MLLLAAFPTGQQCELKQQPVDRVLLLLLRVLLLHRRQQRQHLWDFQKKL